jgi:GMP synthase-like glutamine amidotransferase
MNFIARPAFRIALLDLYEGAENQGMRGIREIVKYFGERNELTIVLDEFEVRLKHQVPDTSYDVYISTGGPGSPLESEGSDWEKIYFGWLTQIEQWNADPHHLQKKYIFFICHSFQLACRYWDLAKVCKRKSTSFGVLPVHLLEEGKEEPVFQGMPDPFYAVDSRDYQVIQPQMNILYKGAKILCIEKDRPHLPFERAIMSIRFNDYFIGTQFHPEADPIGMRMYLQTTEKKKTVIENHGEKKWESMIEQLEDPGKILWTYSHILPNFLHIALKDFYAIPISI